MSGVRIKGPMVRGCAKCGMTLHIIYIEFETNHDGEQRIDIEMMCRGGHRHKAYYVSAYKIEISLNKIDWDTIE